MRNLPWLVASALAAEMFTAVALGAQPLSGFASQPAPNPARPLNGTDNARSLG
jgi:hypothetical protein